jgi:hypothetical protein
MNARRREQLVDGLVEAYVDWRETCDLSDAYRRWTRETGTAGRVRLGLYRAALDAEQQAADVYAGLVQRAAKLSGSVGRTAEPLREPGWGVDWP